MRPALAALLALVAAPLAAQAQTPRSERPFFAELARACPGQNLQNLSPSDLDGVMAGFTDHRLTAAQKRAVQDAVGRRCALIEGGLSCSNNATLDVYRRFHLLKDFARHACDTGLTCPNISDCIQTHR